MKEQLISFETAQLAKEKGFDEITEFAYWRNLENNYHLADNVKVENSELLPHNYSVPTQSLLQKWMREAHNIHMFMKPFTNSFVCDVVILGANTSTRLARMNTYENALEQALQEALKLIP